MSSILEALKKAELEANTVRRGSPAWPVGVGRSKQRRNPGYGWWISLGAVLILVVVGAILWKTRPASTPPPALTSPQALPAGETADRPLVVDANRPDSVDDIAATPSVPPTQTIIEPTAPLSESTEPLQGVDRDLPPAPRPVAPALENNPSRVATRPQAPAVSEPLSDNAAPSEGSSNLKPVDTRPDVPPQRSATVAEAPGARTTEGQPAKAEKKFRTDARIELQALVWAPEASERFVVINGQLVKEGGAVDSITVVQINPEDVLLSEGADRWHHKFTIR